MLHTRDVGLLGALAVGAHAVLHARAAAGNLFAALATQVGRPWFGAKGVGITYPSNTANGRRCQRAKGEFAVGWGCPHSRCCSRPRCAALC